MNGRVLITGAGGAQPWDAPVTRVASLDVPVPFAAALEDAVLPNADKIYRAAVDVLEY